MKKNKLNKNLKSLSDFKDEVLGKVGTKKRDEFEKEFEEFRLGHILHEARNSKGLSQEELANRVGMSKSYISKIENNIKEVRYSTLQKIVEQGLGGKLSISINF